jgi:hypothetical protein
MTTLNFLRTQLPAAKPATWAFIGGIAGLLAAIPGLPTLISAPALLAFVFLGPGSVIVSYVPNLTALVVRTLVPVTGLAVLILVVSLLLFMNFYSPVLTLLVLAAATTAWAVQAMRPTRDRVSLTKATA